MIWQMSDHIQVWSDIINCWSDILIHVLCVVQPDIRLVSLQGKAAVIPRLTCIIIPYTSTIVHVHVDSCQLYSLLIFSGFIRQLHMQLHVCSCQNCELMSISECHYISLFNHTGDVQPQKGRNRPRMSMGDFKQIMLLRLIQENPRIYMYLN